MRKLKLQMQMSADGFVGGPDGQLDWMTGDMDPEQLKPLMELTNSMDTIVMGRKMADGFTTYWEDVADNQPHNPEHPYAQIFVDTPKIIFSKTVNAAKGRNVTVENGDLVSVINALKQKEGKDIIVYGGAGFVSSLIDHKLIDELFLFVNPVSLGAGLRIFKGRTGLKLNRSAAFKNGVVLNEYALL